MQELRIKKGYQLRMDAQPSTALSALVPPKKIAALPAIIPHIKPRLKVAKGDAVQIGSPLFEDKRDPRVQFLSPAGGRIHDIVFGRRRAVEAIIIARSEKEEQVAFPVVSEEQLQSTPRETLVDLILKGGLWWTLRQLPFRDLCPTESAPPLILVGLNALEPFQPNPEVYLQGRENLLAYGIQVLNTLAPNGVHVFAGPHQQTLIEQFRPVLTHIVSGHYPADDPGAVLYHIKKSAEENSAWYINGQDLLLLAQLLRSGRYPVERTISVGGSAAPIRQHFLTRIGVPFKHLVDTNDVAPDTRFVMGGLLRGHTSGPDGFMGLRETALNLVPEGSEAEFLALFNPGLRQPSYSRCFASKLHRRSLNYTCNLNGSLRPCIACMHCADVCPVNILPQLAYKAILAEEIEEALALGLLDCVACGLCSYVCPSKIELSQTLVTAKANYAKETGAGDTG